MAKNKLTDSEAKKILLQWPSRTKIWPRPNGVGYWLRAYPKSGSLPGPKLSSPGVQLFTTQPDGMWVYFSDIISCDVVVIEACGTIQNLNDKRSRYFPSSHSLVLTCSEKWLDEEIPVQSKGQKTRWEASRTIKKKPKNDIQVPVRYLRVLYALPNELYYSWCANHAPTGYEFFCPHSSLDTFTSQRMQRFLSRMSIASQFYSDPFP